MAKQQNDASGRGTKSNDETGLDVSFETLGNEKDDVVCAESELSADLAATNLLFVVDGSGSMKCNAPPFDEACLKPEKVEPEHPSKWESTQHALVGSAADGDHQTGLFQELSHLEGVNAGLLVFPTDDYCGVLPQGELSVPISELDEAHVSTIDSALALEPDGETPLAGAAIRGLELLRQRVVDGTAEGRSYLVLMTDGFDTCQPKALNDLLDYVEQARNIFDISTYVVGAPGSESARALLSELAYLGGTANEEECVHDSARADEGDCHIDLTESDDFSTALSDAFSHIGENAEKRCDIEVPQSAFVDPNKVNVLYTDSNGDEQTLLQDHADCADLANGWQYADNEKKRIVLCGAACRRLRSEAKATVRVIFGCAETLVR